MDILTKIRKDAKKLESKKIILPEYEDLRILKATYEIIKQDIAKIVFIGSEKKIKETIEKKFSKIETKNIFKNLEIFDYTISKNINYLIDVYSRICLSKGEKISKKEVKSIILSNKIYIAALLCRSGKFDGFVAGATYTSKHVIEAAIRCLDKVKGISRVSSSFIIVVPSCIYQKHGFFIFADCGVIKNPSSTQLVDITVASVDLFKALFRNIEPKVALLSFSTKGSAEGENVDKVKKALNKIRKKLPDLLVDGELQVDAALVESVSKKKAPDSVIKGDANILIFPNLESGNISYKLVQRLAKARAVGPILQGFKTPCSDLSRGCVVKDIVDTVAMVSVRANKLRK